MEILILLFFIVIGTSFLCSVLESVILSTTVSYVSVIENKNPTAGKLLKKLKSEIDITIASILIINTIANTLGATAIGVQAQNVFSGDKTLVMIISIILTFMILFFAEIIPKTIGAVYWKELAAVAARIINVFVFITYPIIIITQFVTKKISKNSSNNDSFSREELIHSTLLSEEEGVIGDLESDIIENTLTLNAVKVKDILTPRSVMYAVQKDSFIKDILEDKRTYKFSRVPVYDESIDNIVGVVLTKKLFKQAIKDKNVPIERIMTPVFALNENIPVGKALSKFIQKKEHMFIVLDNYDQTEGLVTLEDCIETLLGLEIMDELDTTADMRRLALNKMKAKRKERGKE
ncbi:transporter [Malaciobacter canalis]|jgi:CBS domain containing-hemolysin-like protein|uniref:CBS domain containing-hemolysin-like protein n=2 Tax=Malaciobacter TaxID=2321114 RepID=A0AB37A1B4_9BACT|nr:MULTISPECIES: CNNM domain-containing protein [Malaciobacter]PHO11089.1 transporter [Malaciobacter canalis]PPK63007.1 CBS domain containing-hemolysin-like protein [Malaciobacter marinus]QEE33173.1 HlyC/CorC family transporter [Malaciobacter canalis]SKB67325.1 Hemolysin, contains CBS domains [Malaciobacter marinus]